MMLIWFHRLRLPMAFLACAINISFAGKAIKRLQKQPGFLGHVLVQGGTKGVHYFNKLLALEIFRSLGAFLQILVVLVKAIVESRQKAWVSGVNR